MAPCDDHRSSKKGSCAHCGVCKLCPAPAACGDPASHIGRRGRGRRPKSEEARPPAAPPRKSRRAKKPDADYTYVYKEDDFEDDEEETVPVSMPSGGAGGPSAAASEGPPAAAAASSTKRGAKRGTPADGETAGSSPPPPKRARAPRSERRKAVQDCAAALQGLPDDDFFQAVAKAAKKRGYQLLPAEVACAAEKETKVLKSTVHNLVKLSMFGSPTVHRVAEAVLASSAKRSVVEGTVEEVARECLEGDPSVRIPMQRRKFGPKRFTDRRQLYKVLRSGKDVPPSDYTYRVPDHKLKSCVVFLESHMERRKIKKKRIVKIGDARFKMPWAFSRAESTLEELFAQYKEMHDDSARVGMKTFKKFVHFMERNEKLDENLTKFLVEHFGLGDPTTAVTKSEGETNGGPDAEEEGGDAEDTDADEEGGAAAWAAPQGMHAASEDERATLDGLVRIGRNGDSIK